MKRSDVLWVNFDPSVGGEIKKRRPALVVSNDASNQHLNRIQVVPVTSNVEKLYPTEAYIELRGELRKAMADQLTTVSKERIGAKLGHISELEMKRVEEAI